MFTHHQARNHLDGIVSSPSIPTGPEIPPLTLADRVLCSGMSNFRTDASSIYGNVRLRTIMDIEGGETLPLSSLGADPKPGTKSFSRRGSATGPVRFLSSFIFLPPPPPRPLPSHAHSTQHTTQHNSSHRWPRLSILKQFKSPASLLPFAFSSSGGKYPSPSSSSSPHVWAC